VCKDVDWRRDLTGEIVPTSQVVGHEIVENIGRTVRRINYFDAHDAANRVSFGGKGWDTISPIPKRK
jgi:hypothetical protein